MAVGCRGLGGCEDSIGHQLGSVCKPRMLPASHCSFAENRGQSSKSCRQSALFPQGEISIHMTARRSHWKGRARCQGEGRHCWGRGSHTWLLLKGQGAQMGHQQVGGHRSQASHLFVLFCRPLPQQACSPPRGNTAGWGSEHGFVSLCSRVFCLGFATSSWSHMA